TRAPVNLLPPAAAGQRSSEGAGPRGYARLFRVLALQLPPGPPGAECDRGEGAQDEPGGEKGQTLQRETVKLVEQLRGRQGHGQRRGLDEQAPANSGVAYERVHWLLRS